MQTKKRRGRVPKDSEIQNNFNPDKIYNMDQETKRQLILEKRKLYRREYRAKQKSKSISTQDASWSMLEDMRYIYKKLGGRKKLEDFMRVNDKSFSLLLKELIKTEIAVALAQLKEKDDTPEQPVVVIFKGLEDKGEG
jgi:hypothetical protein